MSILRRQYTNVVDVHNSIPVTYPEVPLDNSLLVAICVNVDSTDGDGIVVDSITQTGATWNKAFSVADAATLQDIEIWYAEGISGAGSTATVDFSSITSAIVIFAEYTGVKLVNALDKIGGDIKPGASNILNTGSAPTTTKPNEVWIGGVSGINVLTSFTSPSPSTPTQTVITQQNNADSGVGGINDFSACGLEQIVNAIGTPSQSVESDSSHDGSVGVIATFIEGVFGENQGLIEFDSQPDANVLYAGISQGQILFSGSTEATLENPLREDLTDIIIRKTPQVQTSGNKPIKLLGIQGNAEALENFNYTIPSQEFELSKNKKFQINVVDSILKQEDDN